MLVVVGLLGLHVRRQRCEPGVVDGCGSGLDALKTGWLEVEACGPLAMLWMTCLCCSSCSSCSTLEPAVTTISDPPWPPAPPSSPIPLTTPLFTFLLLAGPGVLLYSKMNINESFCQRFSDKRLTLAIENLNWHRTATGLWRGHNSFNSLLLIQNPNPLFI